LGPAAPDEVGRDIREVFLFGWNLAGGLLADSDQHRPELLPGLMILFGAHRLVFHPVLD